MQFSTGALQRRLGKVAPGMGAPGPRGGKKQLAPQNAKPAGSLFKSNPKVGRQFKALHNAKKPR